MSRAQAGSQPHSPSVGCPLCSAQTAQPSIETHSCGLSQQILFTLGKARLDFYGVVFLEEDRKNKNWRRGK